MITRAANSATESVGKLVACFGIASAVSYLTGMIQQWVFLHNLSLGWAFYLNSPQNLIMSGLAWSVPIIFFGLVAYMVVKDIVWLSVVLMVFPILLMALMIVFTLVLPDFVNRIPSGFDNAFFLIFGSVTIGGALKPIINGGGGAQARPLAVSAVVWTIIFIPALAGYQAAQRVLEGGADMPIANFQGARYGIITVVGEKLFLLGCVDSKTLIVEPDAELSVEKSRGDCVGQRDVQRNP